jgi:2-methylcitrate dehydratase PrpD
MISGVHLAPGRLAIDYVRGQGGTPEACVPGTDLVTTAVNAALAGGMCAHADETDDSHPASLSHPGCAVVPAALAMAEKDGLPGAALLRAIAFGYDLAARSTMALGVERIYHQQHRATHSIAALFGAAGAAGALAALNEAQCRWAISFTAQQMSGIACWVRDLTHVEKAFDFAGMGARNGVAAATMVQAGFTGVDDVFSGPRGFFEAYGGEPEGFVRGLGEAFEVMEAHIKKWSIGSPIQAPMDSLEAMIAAHDLTPDNVAAIEVRVSDREAHIVDDRTMPDICLQHCIAVLLIDRAFGFEASHDYARMADPEVQAVRAKIDYIHDPDLPRREGIVGVTTTDGRRLEHHTRFVRGTTGNPMTEDEVAAKARRLIAPALGDARADRLIETVLALETVADARDLRPLLAG